MLLLKPIPVPSRVSCMALGCSEEAVVATHVIMFYENPKAKANVPGSDRLCVAPICTPAFTPSRALSIIPFFFLSLTRLTPLLSIFTLVSGLFKLLRSQLSNAFKIFRHQCLFLPQEGQIEVIL